MKVYIAGNIGALPAEEVITRFEEAERKLQDIGFETISPIRGKKLTHKTYLEATTDYNYEAHEIVHRDLNDIRRADIVLAMMEHPGIGTSMEICYARMVRHIPVIVITSDMAIGNHYWIKAMASKILPDLSSGIEYLKDWYL